MTNTPSWLLCDENYYAKKGNNSFVQKAQKNIVRVLSSFKINFNTKNESFLSPPFRLILLLILIVLTSASKNFAVVLFLITFAISRLAFLKGEKIKMILKVVLSCVFFTAIILIPSLFLNSQTTLITITSKVFVCVTLTLIFSFTTPFSDITSSLRTFFVPNIIIFVFDTTLKHIFLLCSVSSQMLDALKIRTVGKIKKKRQTSVNILGAVFIKAHKTTIETNNAMICRGFTGEYKKLKKSKK